MVCFWGPNTFSPGVWKPRDNVFAKIWILNVKRRSISLFHALSCHPTSQQKQTYLTPKLGIGRLLSEMVIFKLEVSKAKASGRKKHVSFPHAQCMAYLPTFG